MTEEIIEAAEDNEPDDAFAGLAAGLLVVSDANWVHRRVETIDILSTELSRRTVSVDFTVPPTLRSPLQVAKGEVLVPIATLEKAPLRHFDLRDERGGVVPCLEQRANGEIATHALVELATLALEDAEMPSPGDRLRADLRTIATARRSPAEAALSGLYQAADSGDPECSLVLADEIFALLLSILATDFILFAVVESAERRRVLKYGYDEPLADQRSQRLRLVQGLGLAPLAFQIDVPVAAGCRSYHAEVVIPEELRLSYAELVDGRSGEALADGDIDSDRGALHAPDVDVLAQPELLVAIGAERAGFITVAACVTGAITLALWAGATLLPPDPTQAAPSVAILFASSALVSGALTQRGEHRLVSAFFAPLRGLLGLAALVALVAASVLALGASACVVDIVWSSAAGVASLLSALFAVAWWKARGRQVSRAEND
ncbi:hypothetical protein OJ997_05470 [Solirubrobacter phytolaccae]|uniref:Uncharacterized protein n=1 Tax=Solirubrobacter phytolaccae TaxID=1404360 RepID=A0A9X3S703_9ACTN|nr:hypothetical protein [Solirubrobacter phytolaccae]MDA0179733.1 hypothetical protein [Solirubrobacter phytolaccae]